MADKRISQLVERVNIANNDVLPIVASGATTTNKVTVSTLQDWMQSNLDVGVTSVGLSMPSAFVVSNSPVTGSGNISVTGAGTVSQYIRGDGSLADFPSGGGGGGSSVNYYLNGSVSQGTIGGIAYQEMNKVPVLGAGTDFTIAADGYIASFITDAGDPALLEIPAGNWNFETYLQASSAGGAPSFYIELYKVSGATATLIASNSVNPELIAFGTSTTPYFSALAVPTTSLTLTDRLAIRIYVVASGRTITLHTENSNLCQVITTFTTGLTALNGLTAQVQNFATGTSGTDFNISSSVSTHTFNLPNASASARGVVTTGSQTFAGAKTFNSSVTASSLIRTGGTSSQFLKADGSVDSSTYLTTGSAGSTYVPYSGAAASVNLGTHSITANVINSAGSGSGAGQINLRSDAFFTLVNGYGSIASGTTNQFNFYQTTGAGVFRGAIFSLNSITASATRTYTLPDADGTLALTSSLGAYLPLAGGTLTGALSGTSATFSGNVGINGSPGTSFPLEAYINSSTAHTTSSRGNVLRVYNPNTAANIFAGIELGGAGTANDGLAGINGVVTGSGSAALSFYTRDSNTFAERFRIASTGAATFSSSVTASSFNLGNGQFLRLTRSSGGLQYDALGIVAGTDNTRLISTGDFDIVNGALTSYFKVSSTGAATFSSSATVSANFQSSGTTPYWVFQSTGAGGTGYLGFGSSLISGSAATDFILRSDNVLKFAVGNNNSMVINASGNVGIGVTNASTRLSVSGSGNVVSITSSDNSLSLALGYQGTMHGFLGGYNSRLEAYSNNGGYVFLNSSSVWVPASDVKRKRNFEEYTLGIDAIMGLKPTLYNMDFQEDGDEKQVGLIAQEVKEFIPQAYEENDEFIGLNYNAIIVTMVKAIQELKTEIDSLKNQMQ